MQMARSVTIRFDSLPPRARRLDEDELSQVFGGCAKQGDSCVWGQTCCCDNMMCADQVGKSGSICTPT